MCGADKTRKKKIKKLIIAFAAVAVATMANAAAMRWNSGNLYTPTSATDGKFTSSTIAALNTVTAYVWETSTSGLITQLDAGKLYKAYADGKTADLFAGATLKTGGNKSNANAANITGGTYSVGTTVYAAILYVYDDGAGNTYYIENYAQNNAASAAKTTSNLGTVFGGNGTTAGAAITGWTVVPEPTSGLLMLIGMAGLALRRRRA